MASKTRCSSIGQVLQAEALLVDLLAGLAHGLVQVMATTLIIEDAQFLVDVPLPVWMQIMIIRWPEHGLVKVMIVGVTWGWLDLALRPTIIGPIGPRFVCSYQPAGSLNLGLLIRALAMISDNANEEIDRDRQGSGGFVPFHVCSSKINGLARDR